MPIKQAGMKAMRQSRRHAVLNQRVRRNLKNELKTTRKALDVKSEQAKELVQKTLKILDGTAQKHIIHKNKAARLKSRLMKRLHALDKK